MDTRGGRGSDLLPKPGQYRPSVQWTVCGLFHWSLVTREAAIHSHGLKLETFVNCHNNTFAQTHKYTIKVLIVLKSLISTY